MPPLLAAVTASGVVVDAGHSLREAFYMLWETLWALVLGFTVSGGVQAFVPRRQLVRRLGDHRPASVARASLYGMASSSCSYAASAMARSLFAGGADFVAAIIFMVASTNLVVELGVVLVVLIGWQFLAAQLVGGVLMIALLAVAGGWWWRSGIVAEARRRAGRPGGDRSGEDCGGEDRGGDRRDGGGDDAPGWRRRLRSRSGWADAAGYTIGDLTMLRKEMVIGFGVAGTLATVVPSHAWGDLFLHGHGPWTAVDDALVGPLVAILSFVCSVGNIPLAAALWKGGIDFGGVVSFVFADLITLPLLLVYRRQYGGRMAWRILALLWAAMSAAGLATQALLGAAGLVPTTRRAVVAGDTFRLGPTTGLDVAALALLAALYVLHRRRTRSGGGAGVARDPVCGMQVDVVTAPATSALGGRLTYFCSDHCRARFEAAAARHGTPGQPQQDEHKTNVW